MRQPARVVELKIPNELRYEKVAMTSAAGIARQMGFSDEKIADIKTAVSEAVLNAIEHNRSQLEDQKILITFTVDEEKLKIVIQDQGVGFDLSKVATPRIEDKLSSDVPKRGWGLFLIQNLVDQLEIDSVEGEGNRVTLVIYLQQRKL